MLGYSWSSAWAWVMNPSSPPSTLPFITFLFSLHPYTLHLLALLFPLPGYVLLLPHPTALQSLPIE